MNTATLGTGTITLGSALTGYQTFAAAGLMNGDTVSYVIEDGAAWEIGTGVYSSSGPSLSRAVLESSNSGSAISLTGAAVVYITTIASDFVSNVDGGSAASVYTATQSIDGGTANG